ncbi:MAG: chromosome segregation protein SMC, partial [Mesorhizobium sp.]
LDQLEETEAAAIAAEQAVVDARAAESAARPPVQDAKAELARIETEARTLAKILNAASGDLFPSVLEQISVERGYETALGAALGEDLDVPLDRSAPVHWGQSEVQPGDAALPEGIASLASVVRAPAQLARRLAQIGIVEAGDGKRLQALLAPGQRLVSREGALWRWDGFTASADAPTAAAQRLAQKNRLAELDAEAVHATRILRQAEEALAHAEQALARASEAERYARQAGRDAQHGLDAARNELA